MVRTAPRALAQIGRLATPAAESLAGPVDVKVKDFFREVGVVVDEQGPSHFISAGQFFLNLQRKPYLLTCGMHVLLKG